MRILHGQLKRLKNRNVIKETLLFPHTYSECNSKNFGTAPQVTQFLEGPTPPAPSPPLPI